MIYLDEIEKIKVFDYDCWSDGAGTYSTARGEIKYDNKFLNVLLFVCSDYPNQLTIWKGWNCDFYEENILFDDSIDKITNKELIAIYTNLLKNMNKESHKNDEYICLSELILKEECINKLCKKYKVDYTNITKDTLRWLVKQAIEDFCSYND